MENYEESGWAGFKGLGTFEPGKGHDERVVWFPLQPRAAVKPARLRYETADSLPSMACYVVQHN